MTKRDARFLSPEAQAEIRLRVINAVQGGMKQAQAAWRIYHLNKLGRENPEAPCTVYFEEAEWKALMMFTSQSPVPPTKPPTLRDATHRVAGLGACRTCSATH